MSDELHIQWFPGHMAKTRRLMQSNLKLVDIVVELTDARIPLSSRNPEIDKLLEQKPRVLVLNKSDAASASETQKWCAYFKRKGVTAIAADCRSGAGTKDLLPAVRQVLSEKIARWHAKGMGGRPIRMMIVGVPNVGKSSLINRLAGARRTKVEDRPGVTRGKQWVTLEGGVELLDMPGVLWPKFEDKLVGEHLAFTGAVRDQILDTETLSFHLLETLVAGGNYHFIAARYKLEPELETLPGHQLLAAIAQKRGMLIAGGTPDLNRAATMVVDEFRGGVIGRITLEPCTL